MGVERGYGWLAAVIPAEARRFRVADPALAAVLSDAGAELVDNRPDVEIGPTGELRGDAAIAITVLGHPGRDGRSFAVRVMSRLAISPRVRLEARQARREISRLGYATVAVLMWDHQRTLRDTWLNSSRPRSELAEYFPQRALVVGQVRRHTKTLLDAVLAETRKATGVALRVDSPVIRTGLLMIDTSAGILRVAVGPGARQIHNQRAALAALAAAEASPVVAACIPREVAAGRRGLAVWSLERRLSGIRPRLPLGERLLADCLDFLVALHHAGSSASHEGMFLEQAEVVAQACTPQDAQRVRVLAERLETALADVPRGFAHGDFFYGNLLSEGERLVGVADWDAAGAGRLPLIDLLHLRHTSTRELAHIDWGPALLGNLLPWAGAGGDDIVRTYCQRIGLEIDAERLEAFTMAYWLDYVSYRLRTHPHQVGEPLWPERNIRLVLDAIASLRRFT